MKRWHSRLGCILHVPCKSEIRIPNSEIRSGTILALLIFVASLAGGSSAQRPIFAFLHWGEEYSCRPGPREDAIATALRERGVELILGSYPHCASDLSCTCGFCEVYSLGNFIFDQLDPQTSGALLEVTFFPQGTYFLRLHPIGNPYATMN